MSSPGLTRRRQLPFDLQHQQQTNWCWSACATSVSGFFEAASGWTQCLLASRALAVQSCCENGSSRSCNRPYYLDRALTVSGNLASRRPQAIAWAEIQAELDADRPVAARIGWSGGGGHFVMITGYVDDGAGPRLTIQDPWTGTSVVSLADFSVRYKQTGTWTHTYLTKA